ncbi:MAG TPA: N-6 DNA methylase [Gammaproteobacteria bacterium]|nr:N-6 DNA methylase [Gammaproteobacteria bacterium]
MPGLVVPDRLPRSGEARRVLQAKGQFWTPDWVAEAMAAYVLEGRPKVVFDPAVGAGAFFAACRRLGYTGGFAGYENDVSALDQARDAGLSRADLRRVELRDFFTGTKRGYDGILSNPPYLRHHRIGPVLKASLQVHAQVKHGIKIDGRAGLHVHFLLHCLEQLAPGGRLAFLLPADTFEGVFARTLWNWIAGKFRLRAVITFTPEAAPFRAVDTNAVVVAIEHDTPGDSFTWARMRVADGAALRSLLQEGANSHPDVESVIRELPEALETGLTRVPSRGNTDAPCLGDVASVMRGIATGANEFFFLTSEQVSRHRLRRAWFKRAVGRTRDCQAEILDSKQLEALDQVGRPTWLLDLPDVSPEQLPAMARRYLAEGEKLGLPDRALIRMRRHWYRMEQRKPPPILFAYLGRRSCRFILNKAAALPLTGFLCVYPKVDSGLSSEQLWHLLNSPEVLAGLALVGKTYGSGAIKVEPRALERLPLPLALCKKAGIGRVTGNRQLMLMEKQAQYRARTKSRKLIDNNSD